ncbi:MAG: hypothetical protein EVG15_02560 [Candidatus Acididesulfobacter diazotrophicus]|jgi:site-specific recombinase XerD|uniref:Core-binding (CB) domain-containing protein n=1 Tax=Candidatus Acididesulfobacter diazotrophicus TaxID=2597226 RepID=A0A519BP00_9DELT|nr:MAG: hypothetical protein EVG15_02560 [Candidatus Acididesulfobacter diazotrophicus]
MNTKTTIKNKINIAQHFLPVFKDKNISGITQSDIKNDQLKRKFERLSISKNLGKREQEIYFRTVNLEISALHHFFNFCIEKGIVDKNPCAGIKKLNELSRLKTLSDDDIDSLFPVPQINLQGI